MASRKLNSYQWRLFFPLVGIMWLILGAQAVYQSEREIQYKKERLNDELSLVNARIIEAYEDNFDMIPFMHFIANYYEKTDLKGIRISIYSKDGKLLYSLGQLIPFYTTYGTPPEMIEALSKGSGVALRHSQLPDSHSELYFFGVKMSNDGNIYVHTAMPFTKNLYAQVAGSDSRWYVLVSFALIATALAFISTHYLGQNVKMLHKFSTKASENQSFDSSEFDFPNDELGEIAKQIVKMFDDLQAANKRIEQEHHIAIKATEDKIKASREMSNNINHELKTPVGVIKGYLDTISSDPDMPVEQRMRFIAKAQDHMERLCRLINDLSSINRLEDGGHEIMLEKVSMTELMVNITSDLECSNPLKNGIKFKFNLPADCYVVGNNNLLWAMFGNLIRNADFYSGGTECEVTLVDSDDTFYYFSFHDNGKGVGEEHLPFLFDRFYRIDKGRARKAGGTGLGLPIVKNTVIALGGEISVRNSPTTGGLEFIFSLRKCHGDQDLDSLSQA